MTTRIDLPGGPESFAFEPHTAVGSDPLRGAGHLIAPDGTRAALQWEVSPDGIYLMRLQPPDGKHWGHYRVGLLAPVITQADLLTGLLPVLPKLQVIWQRLRTH